MQSALESGSQRYTVRHRVIDREGAVRWIEAYGRVVRDEQGRAVRTRGAALDVTDRQAIEAEREELIRELEAKNTELEQFTYTVSHDLKSPLITMKGFLGLIARDVAEGRTERLREDVAMTSAADGMEYTCCTKSPGLRGIGRVVNPSERAPFGDVAREAAGLVRARLEERKVHLLIDDDLPVVYGDRVRLVEVAQNLLENAAKFLGDQPSPVVRVGVRPGERGSSPVLLVQDNGVGIDPRFHEKVFGLFDKLDPRAEGSGVGLALVRADRAGPRRPCLDRVGRPWPGHDRLLHPPPGRRPARPTGRLAQKEPSLRTLKKIQALGGLSSSSSWPSPPSCCGGPTRSARSPAPSCARPGPKRSSSPTSRRPLRGGGGRLRPEAPRGDDAPAEGPPDVGDTSLWDMIKLITVEKGKYNDAPIAAGADTRLAIPPIGFSDGPRGVVLNHSTAFPVAMARGASWDRELQKRVGDVIGKEIRAQGGTLWGGVCVKLLRHPSWGRAQETLGEDPYLLGELAVPSVEAVQAHNVMGCAKHYALNTIEETRTKVDVRVDERTLRARCTCRTSSAWPRPTSPPS